ncbi:hypothetical protein SH591_14210 [Sphingomonas sp. LY54]|uniref:hypothetical protein n=1 Tax=Sphingomonas sp. LY54 TaxID=3095343 RepID=UPI002D783886|nr:hypothetical protein [Sphingomonas sp. LY54]WRP28241.1 hypothetical protein SH591_14210 [Sphingomonas sp. LY54]
MTASGAIDLNDDAGLEREADAIGIRASAQRPAPEKVTAPPPATARSVSGTIQRTEADALATANALPGAQAAALAAVPPVAFPFQRWANLVAARAVAAGAIALNWAAIATAYTRAGLNFGAANAMIAEATRMFNDPRPWTDPQARREAENVLNQMATARAGLLKQLPVGPIADAQLPSIKRSPSRSPISRPRSSGSRPNI